MTFLRTGVWSGLLTATALVVGLAGCSMTPALVYTPAPSPTTVPFFASDEEAFDAAVEAYDRYSEAVVEIFGGAMKYEVAESTLSEFTTGNYLGYELEFFQEMSNAGWFMTGEITADKAKLQQYDRGSSGHNTVVIYICNDVSAVDVLNAQGESVTEEDRPNRVYFEVFFDVDAESESLKISERTLWRDGTCPE